MKIYKYIIAGCGMPNEDFTVEGKLRSAQSFGWPLTPPPNAPVTCMVVIKARKDRVTKQVSFPALWLDEPLSPWCTKKVNLYRNM